MVDNTLHNYLLNLGLRSDEVAIFQALLDGGQQTAAQISERSAIAKTTVYRRLASLRKLGLVEQTLSDFTTLYRLAHPSRLNLVVLEKEHQLAQLKELLPSISQLIGVGQIQADPTTEVRFFKGVEGVKQMTWNILAGSGDLCGYSFRVFSELGEDFAREWSSHFVRSGRTARDLYSDAYVDSLDQFGKAAKNSQKSWWRNWQSRYIAPALLDIQHQQDIFDDVVAIYNWHEGEVFGVEIHNRQVAQLQRQLFELAWTASASV